MTNTFIFESDSERSTYELGVKLAECLVGRGIKRAFIAIYGDFGSGKTVFTRGFSSVISPGSRVKSPTYTIVNEYLRGETPLYHFDFYRIESCDELDGIGFDDYVNGGVCIGEWCEKLGGELPCDSITVSFEKLTKTDRKIEIIFPCLEVYLNVDLGI